MCKLHIYAAIVRFLTYRKYYEKNEAKHEEKIKDRFSLNFVQGDIQDLDLYVIFFNNYLKI